MSCASGIYTVFTGSSSVVAGGVLPAGTTVRRYGKNLAQAGDGILLDGTGYYAIDVQVIVTATSAGVISVDVTEDGTAIQGGHSSQAVAAGDVYTIPVHAVVRKKCCDTPTTIQVKLNGIGATVNQVTTIILKV